MPVEATQQRGLSALPGATGSAGRLLSAFLLTQSLGNGTPQTPHKSEKLGAPL